MDECEPLLGGHLTTMLRQNLNPLQVVDLHKTDPKAALRLFCNLPKVRIMVCGRGLHSSTSHLNLNCVCHSNYLIFPTTSAHVELESGRGNGLHSATSQLQVSRLCHSNYPKYPTNSAYIQLESGLL